VIYLDTSVLLAELLVEDRTPKASLWLQPLVSSRLLQYETWTRLHALGLTDSHGERARALLGQVSLLEMVSEVLGRALEPFPIAVRTLDALHLASAEFLRGHGETVQLATFDTRMRAAARKLKIPLADV
jgi:predicted nucleic acid-binding protein